MSLFNRMIIFRGFVSVVNNTESDILNTSSHTELVCGKSIGLTPLVKSVFWEIFDDKMFIEIQITTLLSCRTADNSSTIIYCSLFSIAT